MFKLLLTTAAVMTVAAPAMASKARMASLQNAPQIYDTQSIFDNPARAYMMGDFATLEFGATSTASMGANTPENATTNGATTGIGAFYSPNAEGGFVRAHGDNKFGFYLGRKSAFTTRVRSVLGFVGQENPIELMYGFQAADLKWGVSLNYSKSEPKVAGGQQSQESMGARLGVMGSVWEAAVTFGLGSKATGTSAGLLTASPTSDYKGTTGFKVSGGYWFDTAYAYANYYQDGVEVSGVTGTGGGPFAGVTAANIKQTQYEVGVVDTVKADGMNFFYGVSYIGFKSDDDNNANAAVHATYNVEQTQLPFVIGVEADATSWMVLRASAKQNVILGERKPATGDSTANANNTTVALGTGLKFNKFMLDANVAAGSVPATQGNGAINTNSLFTNASLSYFF